MKEFFLNPLNPKHIADFLLHTAERVFAQYDGVHLHQYPLHFRVGSGKATYYQSVRNKFWQKSPTRQITIGVKMIENKLSSLKQASLWRTAKEIKANSYWDGNLTPQTLLCHTLLHEYAHYHQETMGYRQPNKVHDKHFYACLEALYQGPIAQALMNALMTNREFSELSFGESAEQEQNSEHNFAVGDVVSFEHAKQTHRATVLRVNRVRLTVQLTNGTKMYVPKALVF